jgi:hypothetical protein
MGSSAHGQWVLCTLMCMLCCMVLCSTNFLPRVEILLTAAKLSAEPQPVPMRVASCAAWTFRRFSCMCTTRRRGPYVSERGTCCQGTAGTVLHPAYMSAKTLDIRSGIAIAKLGRLQVEASCWWAPSHWQLSAGQAQDTHVGAGGVPGPRDRHISCARVLQHAAGLGCAGLACVPSCSWSCRQSTPPGSSAGGHAEECMHCMINS